MTDMASNPQRTTLQQALSRAMTMLTLLAVLAAGLTVLVTGFIIMRSYAQQNLQLVARYSSYAVEPAVAFNDPVAAMEAIEPIAAAGNVAEMIVQGADGKVIVRWQRPGGDSSPQLTRLIYPDAVTIAIGPPGRSIGSLRAVGNSDSLLRYLIAGAIGALICMAITAFGTRIIARRMHATLVTPLQAIAEVAHAVRSDRNFARRAPPADISEVDDLSQDFNALLDELQDWHGQLDSAHAALVHKASHDPLSGLANRANFIDRVRQAIRQSMRTGDRFAVLFMDGDRFKQTNDQFGHAAGDKVITDVAARLQQLLRTGDVAARLGGDEFAVLVHHLDSGEDASQVAARIAEAMRPPIAIAPDREIAISLSIGIAVYPDDGDDVDSLINHADAQMYAAKPKKEMPDEA